MSDNSNPVIEMRDVVIGAVNDPAFVMLEKVNWAVAPGEFWVIGAPPYSGKSDFLMTTAGLVPPVDGCYKFYGNETRIFDESRLADRLRMGFIFENASLFHHLTVAENIALPLCYHKNLEPAEGAKLVAGLLELTELKPIAEVTPANLPRSWIKRAGLARALMLQPDILVADNPLGGLEARHVYWWARFLDELSRGHKALGGKPMTIIAATDDLRPWRGANRRFALLKDKSFIQLGSWDEMASSSDPLVKELLATPAETVDAPR
ncbi:MAG TPA: ATP-binding cassette domain-containing protein [Verrucomicrobiae bacterium]|jgi:ABC-type transporter Mla maintaining outer membrane lipid asymmetry ATPase subunit MlaF